MGRDYATSRIVQRAGRMVGLQKVGMAPSLLATGGLAMLRGRKRAPTGLVLLAVGATMAWLAGSADVADEPD